MKPILTAFLEERKSIRLWVADDGGTSSPARPRTQQPANRVLDYNVDKVQQSIEKPSPSPFKPRHVLRRSGAVQDPFPSPTRAVQPIVQIEEDDQADHQPDIDDGPIMLDDDDYDNGMPEEPVDSAIGDTQAGATEELPSDAHLTRDHSLEPPLDLSQVRSSPVASPSSPSKKRPRNDIEDDRVEPTEASLVSESGPASKKQKGKPSKAKKQVTIHHRSGEDETIDPALLAYGDSYEADPSLEAALSQPAKSLNYLAKLTCHLAPAAA